MAPITHAHRGDLTGLPSLLWGGHPQPTHCARDDGHPVIHRRTAAERSLSAYGSRCLEPYRGRNGALRWSAGPVASAPVGAQVGTWGHHWRGSRRAPAGGSAALRTPPRTHLADGCGPDVERSPPPLSGVRRTLQATVFGHRTETSLVCAALPPVHSPPHASSGDRHEREGREYLWCGGEADVVTWMVCAHAHEGAADRVPGCPRRPHPPHEGRGGMGKRLGSAGSAQGSRGSG